MKFIMIFLFFAFSLNCYSFNWNNCKRSMDEVQYAGLFLSSTQYISSWGGCSMIGLVPQERPKLFIVQNMDKLIINSAKGEGEYLTSFSKLASCDAHTSQKLPDRLQNNLKLIYGNGLQYDAQEVYRRISELVRTDKELSCKYLGS